MSNRRKPRTYAGVTPLTLDPGVQEWIDSQDPARSRFNAYTCKTCSESYLTIDIDTGVTPMFMRCFATEGCDGQCVSAMYPDSTPPADLWPPVLEWFRPDYVHDLTDWERDHVRRGGLLHRPGIGAPRWVQEAHREAGR